MTEQADFGAGPMAADTAATAVGSGTAEGARHAVRRAAETRRLYAADGAAFGAWCRNHHHAALPAAPATVVAYLEAAAAAVSYGTLARRAAAIAALHRQAGYPSPATDQAVRAVLRAARSSKRTRGAAEASMTPVPAQPSRRRAPAGPAQLARMAARCAGDLAGLRDRALLLLAAAGLGGERLLALDVEHVRFTSTGVALSVPGLDPTPAAPVLVARVVAAAACPVHALKTWLHGSETRFGPVFRKVNRWGGVEHRRLRPDGLRRIFGHRAEAMRIAGRADGPPA